MPLCRRCQERGCEEGTWYCQMCEEARSVSGTPGTVDYLEARLERWKECCDANCPEAAGVTIAELESKLATVTAERDELKRAADAIPTADDILGNAPAACWRKCYDCGTVGFHISDCTPWVSCRHCGSQDTRLRKDLTEMLRDESEALKQASDD